MQKVVSSILIASNNKATCYNTASCLFLSGHQSRKMQHLLAPTGTKSDTKHAPRLLSDHAAKERTNVRLPLFHRQEEEVQPLLVRAFQGRRRKIRSLEINPRQTDTDPPAPDPQYGHVACRLSCLPLSQSWREKYTASQGDPNLGFATSQIVVVSPLLNMAQVVFYKKERPRSNRTRL